jgi:hypothetical protein
LCYWEEAINMPSIGGPVNASLSEGKEQRFWKKYGLAGFLERHRYDHALVNLSDLVTACQEFERIEPRDSMYRVARFLTEQWWEDYAKLVDALSVLLLTWNSTLYLYGGFDGSALEEALCNHWPIIERLSHSEIASLSDDDFPIMRLLFSSISTATARTEDRVESPVACAKALHLLVPKFFPIWDTFIAPAHCCPYLSEIPSVAYFVFSKRLQDSAVRIDRKLSSIPDACTWLLDKSLLKRIDEYNYVTITLPELEQRREKRRRKNKDSIPRSS